jgi:hypothetical protein
MPMTAEAETPNSKTQAPRNLQIPGIKRQRARLPKFEIWSLGFIWNLGVGAWNF